MVYSGYFLHTDLIFGMRPLFIQIQLHPRFMLCSLAIGMLTLFTSLPALADISQATARKLSASGQILPLETIHREAKTIKAGRVLETELESKHGLYIYEIELLDSKGIVWEIKLDAKTGTLMNLEED